MFEGTSSQRNRIANTVYMDAQRLRRTGDGVTADSLLYLHERLVRARGFDAGYRDELLKKRTDASHSLFENGSLKKLPHPDIFLQYQSSDLPRCALVSSHRGQGLEIYVFRYRADLERFLWPLTGICYGPLPEQVTQIAVYDPKQLTALSAQSRTAMIRENAQEAAPIMAALDQLFAGRLPPFEAEDLSPPQADEERKTRRPTISPSSFAQKGRVRHKKRGTGGKGLRRS